MIDALTFGTALPQEVVYFGLLFGLFIIPKLLQRLRIPAAITALGLGALAGPGTGAVGHDAAIELLASLGIVALFLFAGIEVKVEDLRRDARPIAEQLLMAALVIALAAWGAIAALGVDLRFALLIALALTTSSAGFILDSLRTLDLPPPLMAWIRTTVIATELLALAVMFVTLQSVSLQGFALATALLSIMITLLPRLFRTFAHSILPYAPGTEFAFLLMIALACALVTKALGVYYLVGAFVVGMAAQRFRGSLPALASEKMIHAVEAFASVFVPFYFFNAGLTLPRDAFSLGALGFGAAFLLLALPLRLGALALHRRLRHGEPLGDGLRLGVPLLPTLVFTLVIAGILRESFGAPPEVFGGLIVYTLVNTLIPSVVFRAPPVEFESLEAPAAPAAGERHDG